MAPRADAGTGAGALRMAFQSKTGTDAVIARGLLLQPMLGH